MTTESLVFVGSIATVTGAIAAAATNFFTSKRGVTSEVIKNYEVLDKQNKAQLEEWKSRTLKCEDLHREAIGKMGNMQGQLDTTLAILKDRNPETEKFMQYVTGIAAKSENFMSEAIIERAQNNQTLKAIMENGHQQTEILKQLGEFMKGLTTRLAIDQPHIEANAIAS